MRKRGNGEGEEERGGEDACQGMSRFTLPHLSGHKHAPLPRSALPGTPVPISMSVSGAPVVPACAGATITLPLILPPW